MLCPMAELTEKEAKYGKSVNRGAPTTEEKKNLGEAKRELGKGSAAGKKKLKGALKKVGDTYLDRLEKVRKDKGEKKGLNGRGKNNHFGGRPFRDYLKKHLGLTDEQAAQIADIIDRLQRIARRNKEVEDVKKDLKSKQKEIDDLDKRIDEEERKKQKPSKKATAEAVIKLLEDLKERRKKELDRIKKKKVKVDAKAPGRKKSNEKDRKRVDEMLRRVLASLPKKKKAKVSKKRSAKQRMPKGHKNRGRKYPPVHTFSTRPLFVCLRA